MDIIVSAFQTQCGIYTVYVVAQFISICIICKYYSNVYGNSMKFKIEKYLMVCLFIFASTPDSISHDTYNLTKSILTIIL